MWLTTESAPGVAEAGDGPERITWRLFRQHCKLLFISNVSKEAYAHSRIYSSLLMLGLTPRGSEDG